LTAQLFPLTLSFAAFLDSTIVMLVQRAVTLFVGLLTCCLFPSSAFAVETASRITDREIIERLTRVEEGQKTVVQRIEDTNHALGQRIEDTNRRIDELNKALSQRIDELKQDIGQRLEELRQTLLWGLGVTFAGMFALIGFVIWDRRSTLAPTVRQMEGLREREEKLEAALREYARQAPDLAESLRKMGLL
jgi:DNA repair exonuclease SbcCD ATPase subunit